MTFLSPRSFRLEENGNAKCASFVRRVSCDSAKAVVVNGDQQNIRRARDKTRQLGQLSVAQRVHGLMEAKKIKEEAAATVDAEAMEQDGENEIERKLKLMEGGGNKTVNGPLIPLRR